MKETSHKYSYNTIFAIFFNSIKRIKKLGIKYHENDKIINRKFNNNINKWKRPILPSESRKIK